MDFKHAEIAKAAAQLFSRNLPVSFGTDTTFRFTTKESKVQVYVTNSVSNTVSESSDIEHESMDHTLGPYNFGIYLGKRSGFSQYQIADQLMELHTALDNALGFKEDEVLVLQAIQKKESGERRYFLFGDNWAKEITPNVSTLKDKVKEPEETGDDFEDAFEEALSEVEFD